MTKKSKDIRCIHRHTIDEHPKCFKRNLVNYKNDKEFTKNTGEDWYNYPGYKIGYFDIETDNLNADFGTMLSWCIKEKGGKTIYNVIQKKDLFDGLADYKVIESLVEELRKYKIIITYYGTGFDLPYARAKAMHYNLDFPGYGELYHFDLFYTARSKLKLSSRSLANVCDYLNIKGKTPLDKNVWRLAKYGDPKALAEVLDHNIGDVVILEQLHEKLDPLRKWMKRSI